MADEEQKIIIDSDWKQQAQAEKERLAKAEKEAKVASDDDADGGRLPKASLTELIRLLASQALMAMGSQDPQTGQVIVALDLAQFNIDLLAELETKTKGNLDAEEAKLLSQILSELRLVYVDTAKAVSQAMQEGKATMGQAGMARSGRPPVG